MPELPDVAGFQRYLQATALHQRIRGSHLTDRRILDHQSPQMLARRLKGRKIDSARRRGKWLFAELDSGEALGLHFGMSGELDYAAQKSDWPDHARLILDFDSGYRLAVISRRLLGRTRVVEDIGTFAARRELGPDALDEDLGREAFQRRMQGRRGSVKSALMNQSIVAGIGNVYSDEILFQAGLHPRRRMDRLDGEDLSNLYRVMRRVLRTAARFGGDAREAPAGWLLGGRSADTPCPRCGHELESGTVAGRTAWWCPRCQQRPDD
jgi:formamidopyrimidine-DNA glycosylase